MKSMLCMLRKNGSTIPFYREHLSIGIPCHTLTVWAFLHPLQINHARFAGVHSPLPIIIRPQSRASISPRYLWRGGGRQAGGEVTRARHNAQIEKKITSEKKNFLTPPPTTRISRPRRRDETSSWHDENRKEESDREI